MRKPVNRSQRYPLRGFKNLGHEVRSQSPKSAEKIPVYHFIAVPLVSPILSQIKYGGRQSGEIFPTFGGSPFKRFYINRILVP